MFCVVIRQFVSTDCLYEYIFFILFRYKIMVRRMKLFYRNIYLPFIPASIARITQKKMIQTNQK